MERNETPDKETLAKWHNDPKNWKLGVFYYNKLDKRIFPPKRTAILGWTINFASPRSIFVFLLIISLSLVLVPLLIGHSKK